MIREGHENTQFFVGTEIEHSPAMNKTTLFVVGVQPVDIIQWKLSDANSRRRDPITHIYFGANQSFDGEDWQDWEYMIRFCLEKIPNYCTLDLDVKYGEDLLNTALVEFHNFIPMLSVKLPHIAQLGYNATIKLDDKDFAATNPGVWCHSLHNLQKREVFTDWSKYKIGRAHV